jgi:hypothetical protein
MSRVDVATPAPVVADGVVSRAWHAVLAAVITAAIVVQIVLIVHGGTDVNTVTSEGNVGLLVRLVRLFSYFTIQSNLLVLVLAVSLVLNPARDGRLWRVVSADALLGIAITGLVFGTVLARLVHPTGIAAWVNAGFHYFSPAATVLGWLLFGPRPSAGCSSGRCCGSPTPSPTAPRPAGTRTRSSTCTCTATGSPSVIPPWCS